MPKVWFGVAALLVVIPLAMTSLDTYQSVTHTGRYRQDWSGTVVAASPSARGILEFLRSPKQAMRWHSRDTNLGNYAATVRTDDGQTITIAMSTNEYQQTTVPSYVVVRGGKYQRFASKAEATGGH